MVASCVSTGDLACNSGTCPDWESNQRPCCSQAGAQSSEPHQPGRECFPLAKFLVFLLLHPPTAPMDEAHPNHVPSPQSMSASSAYDYSCFIQMTKFFLHCNTSFYSRLISSLHCYHFSSFYTDFYSSSFISSESKQTSSFNLIQS